MIRPGAQDIHLSVAALLNGPRLWRSPAAARDCGSRIRTSNPRLHANSHALRLGSATAAVRFQSVPGAEVRSFGAHLTVAVTTTGPVFSLFRSEIWDDRERRVQLHRSGLA